MSVVQLAGYVGLHPQSLRNIENGRRSANDDVMRHLSRVLGVPVEAITRSGTDCGIEADPAEPKAKAA